VTVRDAAYYENVAQQHEDEAERLLAAGNDAALHEKRLAERYRKLAEAARER
jgi:beta-glucosidase-like glycosyl hydrolase